jgi:hypothetical protein
LVGQLPRAPSAAAAAAACKMAGSRALSMLLLVVACVARGELLPPPALQTSPLAVPHRTLMGPGPSTAHPRVLASSSLPMVRCSAALDVAPCAWVGRVLCQTVPQARACDACFRRTTDVRAQLGHMHPEFTKILSDTALWLRYAFQASAASAS